METTQSTNGSPSSVVGVTTRPAFEYGRAHRVSYSNDTGVLFRGQSDRRREANHSPPSNTEVKYKWSYTSNPHVCLRAVDRENFTFT